MRWFQTSSFEDLKYNFNNSFSKKWLKIQLLIKSTVVNHFQWNFTTQPLHWDIVTPLNQGWTPIFVCGSHCAFIWVSRASFGQKSYAKAKIIMASVGRILSMGHVLPPPALNGMECPVGPENAWKNFFNKLHKNAAVMRIYFFMKHCHFLQNQHLRTFLKISLSNVASRGKTLHETRFLTNCNSDL